MSCTSQPASCRCRVGSARTPYEHRRRFASRVAFRFSPRRDRSRRGRTTAGRRANHPNESDQSKLMIKILGGIPPEQAFYITERVVNCQAIEITRNPGYPRHVRTRLVQPFNVGLAADPRFAPLYTFHTARGWHNVFDHRAWDVRNSHVCCERTVEHVDVVAYASPVFTWSEVSPERTQPR